jgi:UPF0271 protein
MTRSLLIDLNCDLGEYPDRLHDDIALLDHVTSANIACGGHAGDEATMRAIIIACMSRGVRIGAHPGYEDRPNFGRVSLPLSPEQIRVSVAAQVTRLLEAAHACGATLSHVKPHGALYHDAMHRREVADAIAQAVRAVAGDVALVGLAGAPALEWWAGAGMPVIAEAFADRRYEADGSLRARTKAGAMIEDPQHAGRQARLIAVESKVVLDDGSEIGVLAQTICIHSDSPGSASTAARVAAALCVSEPK